MSFIYKQSLPKFKNVIFTILLTYTLFSPVLSYPENSKNGCSCFHPKHKSWFVHTKNVGYAPFKGPVQVSHECLDPQEIFGATTTIHIGSAVSPTIAVNPKNSENIVVAWQQDRISNGGALEVGIAYSKDGGNHWKKSLIPLQNCIGGLSQRISNVWLSFARDGTQVYLSALVVNATQDINTQNQSGIIVTTSQNGGKTWSNPHFVDSSLTYLNEPTGLFPFPDKSTNTADRNHANFAYTVWDRFATFSSSHSVTEFSRTIDKGTTWSPHTLIYDAFPDLTIHGQSNGIENDNGTVSNVIVVLPEKSSSSSSDCPKQKDSENLAHLNGDLLNFMNRFYAKPGTSNLQYTKDSFPYQFTLFDIAFVRSQNKGISWDSNATVVVPASTIGQLAVVYTGGYTYDNNGNISGGVGTLMRTGAVGGPPGSGGLVVSTNVNPKNGFLYVVYQTGQFRADRLPQIALTTSRDGGLTWSDPVQINRTPSNVPNPQAFTPFVAVTENGRVGIIYSDFRNDDKSKPNKTKIDTWLAIYKEKYNPNGGSTGIGLEFVKEIRLSKHSYIAQNGPTTSLGIMTNGDYSFLDAQENNFYAAYTKSHKGPFNPLTEFLKDPMHNAIILLDDNYRQSPYVSIIKRN